MDASAESLNCDGSVATESPSLACLAGTIRTESHPNIGSPLSVSPVKQASVLLDFRLVSRVLKCRMMSVSPSWSTSSNAHRRRGAPANDTVSVFTVVASKYGVVRMATGITPFLDRLMLLGQLPGLISIGAGVAPGGSGEGGWGGQFEGAGVGV